MLLERTRCPERRSQEGQEKERMEGRLVRLRGGLSSVSGMLGLSRREVEEGRVGGERRR